MQSRYVQDSAFKSLVSYLYASARPRFALALITRSAATSER
jgi:hypothetical protein